MPKLIQQNTDGTQEEYAGVTESEGAVSAGQFPTLDLTGKLDPTTLPDGVGADILTKTASEAVSSGDYIYVQPSGEIAKADATSQAKKAIGFAIEAGASGAQVKIQFDDSNANLSGLTPGTVYYLSATTAGAVTDTAPTDAGHIVQSIGTALDATTIHSDIAAQPVTRA